MNIAPDANGLPLKEYTCQPLPIQDPNSSMVYLTQTSTLPQRKGRFLEAQVNPTFEAGTELLFEPNAESLRALGLSAQESLLCVQKNGMVLIPLQNFNHKNLISEHFSTLILRNMLILPPYMC